jgi:hypothetical protein
MAQNGAKMSLRPGILTRVAAKKKSGPQKTVSNCVHLVTGHGSPLPPRPPRACAPRARVRGFVTPARGMSTTAFDAVGPFAGDGLAKKQKTNSVKDVVNAAVTAFVGPARPPGPRGGPPQFLPSRTDSAYHLIALLRSLFQARYYDTHLTAILVNKALSSQFNKSLHKIGTGWQDRGVFERSRYRTSAADFDFSVVTDAVRSRVSHAHRTRRDSHSRGH